MAAYRKAARLLSGAARLEAARARQDVPLRVCAGGRYCGVILPPRGGDERRSRGQHADREDFTTVQNKNLPVIAIDPGHGGTDPGSEGSGLWEYEMTGRWPTSW